MTAPLRRIASLETKGDKRLFVFWDDGSQGTIDLSSEIARGGVFAGLADDHVFHQVRIGSRRRSIEWRGQNDEPLVDIDADALWHRTNRDSFLKTILRALHLGAPSPA
jgi:hypothetical protein